MNNLLFTALLIALLYYFFYYLPSHQKLTANPPLQHHQFTQTETIIETEPGTIQCPGPEFNSQEIENLKKDPAIDELKRKNQELETKLSEKENFIQTEITKIKTQMMEFVNGPSQTDVKDLENTLDTLIKNIQELNNSLN